MIKDNSELKNSVLIVAHPDDEVLWFGSLLATIDHVIIVYRDYHAVPGLGKRRKNAIAELPFAVTCLELPEAGSFGLANWTAPMISNYGIELSSSSSATINTYQENYGSIYKILSSWLKPNMNVFTHNPWGEYGHEDHVQVFRAVEHLATKIGFTPYVSCYVSSRSQRLANRYIEKASVTPIDGAINALEVNKIADIYKRWGCWTWANDWTWNEHEYFHACPSYRNPECGDSIQNSPKLLHRIPATVQDRLPPPVPRR